MSQRNGSHLEAAREMLAIVAILRGMNDPAAECAQQFDGTQFSSEQWEEWVLSYMTAPALETSDEALAELAASGRSLGSRADSIYEPRRHEDGMNFSVSQAMDNCDEPPAGFEHLSMLFDARHGTLASHELIATPTGFLFVSMDRATDEHMQSQYEITDITWYPDAAADAAMLHFDEMGEQIMHAADASRHSGLAAAREVMEERAAA